MIPMQKILNPEILNQVTFLTGKDSSVQTLSSVPVRIPFCEEIKNFLNAVSKLLMRSKDARQYSDVITFAFWIRKSSVNKLQERFSRNDDIIRVGRGVIFHIAPSNVPVNFAYSLVAGLLNGNINIVRVPSKDFKQVSIIASAINEVLSDYEELKSYIFLVRYNRDSKINDLFSSYADMRVVWGGDATIAELRKSPLAPRSVEITFADRYSIAIIDSDSYLALENKAKVAEDFYNDTFFSDQNACTSPRIVIWTGGKNKDAKRLFWEEAHKLVKQKYDLKAIQAVNKLTNTCCSAVALHECKVEEHEDNLIIRVSVPKVDSSLMNYKGNSGFFFEYDCKNILDIKELCDDKRCQTIGYIGDSKKLLPLIQSGIRGIDRIVPIGKTMDFDLIWDGYDLTSIMTRTVIIE